MYEGCRPLTHVAPQQALGMCVCQVNLIGIQWMGHGLQWPIYHTAL
jgi:hypothetical protein